MFDLSLKTKQKTFGKNLEKEKIDMRYSIINLNTCINRK
jgi:hypothetical protein